MEIRINIEKNIKYILLYLFVFCIVCTRECDLPSRPAVF